MYVVYKDDWEEYDNYEVDPYRELRQVLAPEYARLPPDQLEDALATLLGEASPEDLENFLKKVKKFGRSAARVAKRALPGVVQGATAGAAAGPWGMLAGGLAGGALSAARGGRQPSRPAHRPAPSVTPVQRPAAARSRIQPRLTRQRIAARVRPAQGTPSAAQILALISRPEFQQALMSMLLGTAGQRQTSVGNIQAPLGAFTNLLGVLANRASTEYQQIIAGEASGIPEYLLDETGEFLCDVANSEERADVLWNRLMATAPEFNDYIQEQYFTEEDDYYVAEYEDDYEYNKDMDMEELEELYDALDLAEAYDYEDGLEE